MKTHFSYILPAFFWLLIPFWTSGCSPDGDGNSSSSSIGKPCMSDSNCGSGRCIPAEGGAGICTSSCTTGECPDGYFCANITSAEETPAPLCYPISQSGVCKRCSSDQDCRPYGARCLEVEDQGRRCVMDCSIDTCPDGFKCSTLEGHEVCLPVGTAVDCDCNAFKEGVKLSCENSNEYGTCHGVAECLGKAGWGPCTAPDPIPEICDGKDNNCDGDIDEGVLNTPDNCGSCGNTCPGEGIPGTTRTCNNGQCGLQCLNAQGDGFTDFYDANGDLKDGCECVDDTIAPHSIEDTVSLGVLTSCDFKRQITGLKIPVDVVTGPAPADYYQFNYDNVWNCLEELGVELEVKSSSLPHELCVSSANNTDESTWKCITVNPGETKTLDDVYDNDGVYYIRVSVPMDATGPVDATAPYEGDCAEYTLWIKDPA